MVNQQIFLPMIPDSAPIVINISQYDYDAAGYAGRLYFNLISNGTAYDMNGASAVFQGEKPDGTTFAYAGTVVNASVVRVNVRQQMTAVAGRVVCQLVLNNSEGQIGSFNVWLEVQESATSGSTPSQTDIPALVAQAKQYADEAEQSAQTAAAYSGHPPYIGANNNWFVWDDSTSQFVDTDVEALGQGITSITKTGTSGLVDTYTILYTNGSSTTFDVTNGTAPNITMTAQADDTSSATPTVTVTQGGTIFNPTYDLAFSGLKGQQGAQGVQGPTGPSGRGITSIAKTGTSGLVDTYTITYSDNTTSIFTVTNGQNGTGSGDMLQTNYDPTLAVYNAGGIVSYVAGQIPAATTIVDNLNSTSSTSALSANMGHDLNVNKIDNPSTKTSGDVLTYDGSGWKAQAPASPTTSLAALTDTTITSPTDGQILEYDAVNSKWINGDNISSFARYGGSKTFSQLTSALLVAANEDKFYLCTDGGTISAGDAANWILPQGSVIPADSHIAVVNTGTAANPVYKFDDFGGYVDLSGLAQKTELDGWTAAQTIATTDTSKTFTGLDTSYAYKPYIQVADGEDALPYKTMVFSGTSCTVTFDSPSAAQAAGNACQIKLRIVK